MILSVGTVEALCHVSRTSGENRVTLAFGRVSWGLIVPTELFSGIVLILLSRVFVRLFHFSLNTRHCVREVRSSVSYGVGAEFRSRPKDRPS
jgi:hypothetical protein